MSGSAITTARRRKSAPCPRSGRAEFRKNFTDRRYIAILMNKYIFSKVFFRLLRPPLRAGVRRGRGAAARARR
ncbi:MAG: hypothetical protein ACLSHG_11495 [Oscillospiraceae bacterium]